MGYPSDRSSNAAPAPQPTLITVVRERLRLKHYSLRTEQSYVGWVRRYIRFHGRRHPREMGAREVLGIDLTWLDVITRAKAPEHVPVVLSRSEIDRLFGHLDGTHALMARLLYGTGMRLMECVRLRV